MEENNTLLRKDLIPIKNYKTNELNKSIRVCLEKSKQTSNTDTEPWNVIG